MRPEFEFLLDIRNAANTIRGWIENIERESFFESDLYQSAVLFQLMIIGEAVTRVSQDLKDRYPNIDWSSISGFRNIIVHSYFNLSLPIVWVAAFVDSSALKDEIEMIISREYPKAK